MAGRGCIGVFFVFIVICIIYTPGYVWAKTWFFVSHFVFCIVSLFDWHFFFFPWLDIFSCNYLSFIVIYGCIQLLIVFHLVPYLTISYMWCTFYLSIVTGFPVFTKDNPPLGKIQNPILAQPIPNAIFFHFCLRFHLHPWNSWYTNFLCLNLFLAPTRPIMSISCLNW